MPPMSRLRTFIEALRTGETRTTRALEQVVSRRRSAVALEMIESLRKRGALNAPLRPPFRPAFRRALLPEEAIAECIDGWPDEHKERVRRAIVGAIDSGRRVRFSWGLTAARGCETQIDESAREVSITVLSPRSSLRVDNDDITVAPVRPMKVRHARRTRATSKASRR